MAYLAYMYVSGNLCLFMKLYMSDSQGGFEILSEKKRKLVKHGNIDYMGLIVQFTK